MFYLSLVLDLTLRDWYLWRTSFFFLPDHIRQPLFNGYIVWRKGDFSLLPKRWDPLESLNCKICTNVCDNKTESYYEMHMDQVYHRSVWIWELEPVGAETVPCVFGVSSVRHRVTTTVSCSNTSETRRYDGNWSNLKILRLRLFGTSERSPEEKLESIDEDSLSKTSNTVETGLVFLESRTPGQRPWSSTGSTVLPRPDPISGKPRSDTPIVPFWSTVGFLWEGT